MSVAALGHTALVDDLVAFLKARLGEDEATARSTFDSYLQQVSSLRQFREVEAKRAILEMQEPGTSGMWPVLVAIAAVYRDHPDYRDEWKP